MMVDTAKSDVPASASLEPRDAMAEVGIGIWKVDGWVDG